MSTSGFIYLVYLVIYFIKTKYEKSYVEDNNGLTENRHLVNVDKLDSVP